MRCLPALRAALTAITMLLVISTFGPAVAGEPGPPDVAQTRAPTDQVVAGSSLGGEVTLNVIDQRLAVSLAVEMWGQIAASEALLPLLHDEQLKRSLSERLAMQKQLLEQLEVLTDGRCQAAIDQALREIARDAARDATRPVRFRPLSLNASAIVVRIRVEILQEYTEQINRQLATCEPAELDRLFARIDALHQMQMLSMLQVFAGQASPDFAEVIQRVADTAAENLAQSRSIIEQLEATALATQPVAKQELPLVVETTSAVAQ